jgi:hypothetical protein
MIRVLLYLPTEQEPRGEHKEDSAEVRYCTWYVLPGTRDILQFVIVPVSRSAECGANSNDTMIFFFPTSHYVQYAIHTTVRTICTVCTYSIYLCTSRVPYTETVH